MSARSPHASSAPVRPENSKRISTGKSGRGFRRARIPSGSRSRSRETLQRVIGVPLPSDRESLLKPILNRSEANLAPSLDNQAKRCNVPKIGKEVVLKRAAKGSNHRSAILGSPRRLAGFRMRVSFFWPIRFDADDWGEAVSELLTAPF